MGKTTKKTNMGRRKTHKKRGHPTHKTGGMKKGFNRINSISNYILGRKETVYPAPGNENENYSNINPNPITSVSKNGSQSLGRQSRIKPHSVVSSKNFGIYPSNDEAMLPNYITPSNDEAMLPNYITPTPNNTISKYLKDWVPLDKIVWKEFVKINHPYVLKVLEEPSVIKELKKNKIDMNTLKNKLKTELENKYAEYTKYAETRKIEYNGNYNYYDNQQKKYNEMLVVDNWDLGELWYGSNSKKLGIIITPTKTKQQFYLLGVFNNPNIFDEKGTLVEFVKIWFNTIIVWNEKLIEEERQTRELIKDYEELINVKKKWNKYMKEMNENEIIKYLEVINIMVKSIANKFKRNANDDAQNISTFLKRQQSIIYKRLIYIKMVEELCKNPSEHIINFLKNNNIDINWESMSGNEVIFTKNRFDARCDVLMDVFIEKDYKEGDPEYVAKGLNVVLPSTTSEELREHFLNETAAVGIFNKENNCSQKPNKPFTKKQQEIINETRKY